MKHRSRDPESHPGWRRTPAPADPSLSFRGPVWCPRGEGGGRLTVSPGHVLLCVEMKGLGPRPRAPETRGFPGWPPPGPVHVVNTAQRSTEKRSVRARQDREEATTPDHTGGRVCPERTSELPQSLTVPLPSCQQELPGCPGPWSVAVLGRPVGVGPGPGRPCSWLQGLGRCPELPGPGGRVP